MSILSNSAIIGLLGAPEGGGGDGYSISRSVRFNSSDSAYLSRTPSTAGNRKTWTWAGWVKRSAFGSLQYLFDASGTGIREAPIRFVDTDAFGVANLNDPFTGVQYELVTTAVFRDPSAWYHFVVAFDTTQSTASNRIKIYVNGVQVTSFSTSTYPSQNTDYGINSNVTHYIGRYTYSPGRYFNGYLADVHFIDGQALDPTSFGEFDDNGIWQPIEYSGSFGTNGFHLPFDDNSTAAALGTDTSGNSNTWTVNNLSVTAGAANDSLVDSPTNGTQTDTGVGGEVVGNYATLNPLSLGSQVTIANGNLDWTASSVTPAWQTRYTFSSIGVSSGKWYTETTITNVGTSQIYVGVITAENTVDLVSSSLGFQPTAWGYYVNGNIYNNGSIIDSTPASYTTGDIIGVALDVDSRTVAFYKNGVQQGSTATSLTANKVWMFAANSYSTAGQSWNFGQRPFAYTAPSGFKALCTANLDAPVVTKPNEYMDIALYTGNGSTQTISGLEFSPDFVWIKSRSVAARSHVLLDTVRGVQNTIFSNLTIAEATTNSVTAFTADGFSLGNYVNANELNTNYVGWTWDAGSSTVPNNDGSITSSVRANPSAGFSIVTWTPQATAGTVGHGLGVAPAMIITKDRNTANGWFTYHSALGATKYLVLNLTNAVTTNSTVFSTAPTSTVFDQGTGFTSTAGYGNQVCYCFAPVDGYSSFGSYVGNGSSDGPMVFTNFRPRWILIKNTSISGDSWVLWDTARETYNAQTSLLFPNLANAETANAGYAIDVLSNGFKLRTSSQGFNRSNDVHVYAAFAEAPFQYARAR